MRPLLAIALLVGGAGCKGGDAGDRPAPARQRVNAVAASAADAPDPAEVCDVFRGPDKAAALEWPALTAEAPGKAAGWRWINVWATWCAPCIEELPLLADWRARLERAGVKLELTFVSADADDEAIAAFRAEHPETPEDSLRLDSPDVLAPWLESLGVPGASLPVHVFVDPDGRVRCVRASAVGDADYDAIAALLGAS